jgi:hypothetical protein
MKTIKTSLTFFFILFGFSFCAAQMGMGGGMNGMNPGGMGVGMDRRLGGNNSMNTPPSKPEKIDYVQVTVDKLEKDLGLDTFQKAVIKQAFDDGQLSIQAIIDSKNSDEMKETKIADVRANVDNRILKVLDKSQTEKYQKLKEKNSKKK